MKYAIGHDPGGAVHQKYLKQPNFPVAYLIGVDGKGIWEGFPDVKKEKVEEMEKLMEEELAKIRK